MTKLIGKFARYRIAGAVVIAVASMQVLLGGQDSRRAGRLYVVDANKNGMDAQVHIVDPLEGRVTGALSTGHKPDLAVSSDGSRLYLAHSPLAEGKLRGVLDVVDTTTGRTVASYPNPNRWLSTLPFYSSRLALSFDGRWLFQLKMSISNDDFSAYYVETFDTVAGQFLPNTAPVPMCVAGLLIPWPESREKLGVLCSHTKDLRMLTLTATGGVATDERMAVASRRHGHPGTAFFAPGSRALTAVSDMGEFIRADSAGTIPQKGLISGTPLISVQNSSQSSGPTSPDWLAGRWIRPQPSVIASKRGWLYLGIDAVSSRAQGRQQFESVAVLDLKTLQRRFTLPLSRPSWSITLSVDGSVLYAVDPAGAVLLVLDAITGREVKVIHGVGTTPIFAISTSH